MREGLTFLGLVWICLALPLAARADTFDAGPATCCDDSNTCDECGCDCNCECCDCCENFNDCERILGMLPSDHCFDSFISPVSSYCQKLWMAISGGGFLGFDSVDEWSPLDHVGQQFGAVEEAPTLLGGLHQLEDHAEAR
jgi:hypothetical protein